MAPNHKTEVTLVSQGWALFAKFRRLHSSLCALLNLQKSPQPCDPGVNIFCGMGSKGLNSTKPTIHSEQRQQDGNTCHSHIPARH